MVASETHMTRMAYALKNVTSGAAVRNLLQGKISLIMLAAPTTANPIRFVI